MECRPKRWIIAKLAALIAPFALLLANVTGRACQHKPHTPHTHSHTHPCTFIIMLIIIMRFVALCQPQVPGCLAARVPGCLLPACLPGAWCLVEWWLLLGSLVARWLLPCASKQCIFYTICWTRPLGTYPSCSCRHQLSSRGTTFGRDLSCNLARKGEILVPHKLIPAMPFSRITNRRLAKHTQIHRDVCVCVSWHPLWWATAMWHDRQLGNRPRFRSS